MILKVKTATSDNVAEKTIVQTMRLLSAKNLAVH